MSSSVAARHVDCVSVHWLCCRQDADARESRRQQDQAFHDIGTKTQVSRATQRRQSRQDGPNQRTKQAADAGEILDRIAPRRAKKSRHESMADIQPERVQDAASAVAPVTARSGTHHGRGQAVIGTDHPPATGLSLIHI